MATILKQWRTVYKLTDASGQTRNNTQWGPGVTNPCGVLSGQGDLCSAGYYHAYHTPELAAFLNPIGGNFDPATCLFWLAEIRGTVQEEAGILKLGSTEQRTVVEIPAIRPTTDQRVAFGLLCALAMLDANALSIPAFEQWAHDWLDGRPAARTAAAARAARAARAILCDAAVLALAEPWEVVP